MFREMRALGKIVNIGTSEAVALSPLDLANRVSASGLFGLVTVRAVYPAPLDGLGTVSVDVAPASGAVIRATFAAADCGVQLADGSTRLLVNLLTHLIPDGPARITFRIGTRSGETLAYPALHVSILNEGELAGQVADDLLTAGAEPILPRVIDAAMFPYESGNARAWFDIEDAEDAPLSFDQATDLDAAHRHLRRWGFCILPERLSTDIIDAFKIDLEESIESGALSYQRGSSQRILNAHRLPSGRKIWLYPPVMQFLNEHFRDTPCACQTLTYVHGSEQNAHQDTIHLTPYPAGYMCGVWIALEDVQPASGELFVYPGSHRVRRLRAGELGLEKVDEDYSSYAKFEAEIRAMMEEGGFQRVNYLPKAGQILVWHENLVHGGHVRESREKTRLSIVSHYFAKGSVAYYDSRGEAASLEALPTAA